MCIFILRFSYPNRSLHNACPYQLNSHDALESKQRLAMKNPQIPPVDYTSPCNFRRRSAVWLLAIVLAPLMSVAHAQDSKARQAAPSADELRARARAAQAARNGADPEAIARANRLLLATALRESADLKVLEGQSTAALDFTSNRRPWSPLREPTLRWLMRPCVQGILIRP